MKSISPMKTCMLPLKVKSEVATGSLLHLNNDGGRDSERMDIRQVTIGSKGHAFGK